MTEMRWLTALCSLTVIALAHCGSTVPLENRPCPCSDDWTCCAEALVCVPRGAACPAPPSAYCIAPWYVDETWCVFDATFQDDNVCRFPDSPTVQVDFDGDRDECSKGRDPAGLYRSLDCNVFFAGQNVQGMVVDHGAQLVQHDADKCRLRAPLLMNPPAP
jgi:hypothetical protein